MNIQLNRLVDVLSIDMRMTEQDQETCRKLREAAERLSANESIVDDTSDNGSLDYLSEEREYTIFPEVSEGWRQ